MVTITKETNQLSQAEPPANLSFQAAEDKCVRLLAVRERSSQELRSRLHDAGFSTDIIQALVNRLQSTGLVDDQRFCHLYVESKRRQGWGMQRIHKALKVFGIELEDYADLSLEYSDEGDELQRASEALLRYRGRARDAYTARYRFLITKGFSPTIVYQTMNNWRTNQG
jgi:regulatory protein